MVQKINKSARLRKTLSLRDTDAYRLVDGARDSLPGIYLETFAGRRLFSTESSTLPSELRAWADQDPNLSTYWKRLDQQDKEPPSHLSGPAQNDPFEIREQGARFLVNLQSGYSQGIFLDQRDNRARVRVRCEPEHTILNTFAYTGAFSVTAALGGACTTTLDLSQPYLDWTRENFTLNGIDASAHHFCRGDTFHWLRRFSKQGRQFTGLILDPPTFSRDDTGRVFRAERDYGSLVQLASECLEPGGWLLCTTNCRRLPAAAFTRMVSSALPSGVQLTSHPMPPDFTGTPYLKTLFVET